MKNRNLINSLSPLLWKGARRIRHTSPKAFRTVRRVSQQQPTPQQIAIAFGRSLEVMMEIRHRAETPFRSAAPGPDYQPEPIYPPILSRL